MDSTLSAADVRQAPEIEKDITKRYFTSERGIRSYAPSISWMRITQMGVIWVPMPVRGKLLYRRLSAQESQTYCTSAKRNSRSAPGYGCKFAITALIRDGSFDRAQAIGE